MNFLLNLALGIYLAALVLASVNLALRRDGLERAARVVLLAGVLALTAYIGLRWKASGRAPFSNMFESLVLLAWAVPIAYETVRARLKAPWLTAPTALFAALALAYAGTYGADIKPLMPALRSNWLAVHVFTCFLGYAGLAVSFLAAIGHLAAARPASRARPETGAAFEATVIRSVSFGFLFLSVGIVTGAVWANAAWGTYWSWDPKETWALITWLVYAFLLHCRQMESWRGRLASWVAVLGFASVLFTYFGVNYLMSGLHSYAS
jgi:cytochrome c-type biogenesis protein CcsB